MQLLSPATVTDQKILFLYIDKVNVRINILLIIFPEGIIFMGLVCGRPVVDIGIVQLRGTHLRILQDRGILINIAQLELKLAALPDTEQVARTAQPHILR